MVASPPPISAIVLTFNEARHIETCLRSLEGVVSEIFVVDSGSTDNTVELAQRFGARVVYHPFENYSQQRNWALQNLSLQNEWVLHLDADHRLTENLRQALWRTFTRPIPDDVNGFLISRRTLFMGRWIRYGGHYPVYHAVLFRRGKGYCETRRYDQHFRVEGKVLRLQGDIEDVVTDSLHRFIERHNTWAALEAEEQLTRERTSDGKYVEPNFWGTPQQRRRFWKRQYERLPLFVRPFLYFVIRYFFRLGFLDGPQGLIFHVLQGFWFRFLIDAKIYEQRQQHRIHARP
ncbi:MAG: glycosyltransferase family 2 protein [Saprospiraceae bacterium]|nr:glycosyltransferase family 2 protein [Saprospiraceae bacterium]MDW8483363.1 glycosyltransferase family 2 protein [Saprospiraceae bacterium]